MPNPANINVEFPACEGGTICDCEKETETMPVPERDAVSVKLREVAAREQIDLRTPAGLEKAARILNREHPDVLRRAHRLPDANDDLYGAHADEMRELIRDDPRGPTTARAYAEREVVRRYDMTVATAPTVTLALVAAALDEKVDVFRFAEVTPESMTTRQQLVARILRERPDLDPNRATLARLREQLTRLAETPSNADPCSWFIALVNDECTRLGVRQPTGAATDRPEDVHRFRAINERLAGEHRVRLAESYGALRSRGRRAA